MLRHRDRAAEHGLAPELGDVLAERLGLVGDSRRAAAASACSRLRPELMRASTRVGTAAGLAGGMTGRSALPPSALPPSALPGAAGAAGAAFPPTRRPCGSKATVQPDQ
jgi:hypothetical protein